MSIAAHVFPMPMFSIAFYWDITAEACELATNFWPAKTNIHQLFADTEDRLLGCQQRWKLETDGDR